MAKVTFHVNQHKHEVDIDPAIPILWVLRDNLGLVGTKYGCGISQCGTCTVHLNGIAVRSCTLPISAAHGKDITTIEGLSEHGDHPVQEAWIEEDVAQCGYCQPGQIMAATALLNDNKNPSDEDIDVVMAGQICRCGTYNRIRKAIHLAARKM